MNGLGAALTLFFCVAVAGLPRRWAPLAYLGAVLYITQGQALNVGGINFMAIRFVEVAAFVRVCLRGELPSSRSLIDKWLIATLTASAVIPVLRTGAIDVYRLGLLVDGLLVFFTFRAFLNTVEEYAAFLKGAAYLLFPFALFMIYEGIVGYNLFSLMGGVYPHPVYRDGYFRCQGTFRHAITAGTVGATFLPLFATFFLQRSSRLWAGFGAACCITIVLASHSSGPLMAAGVGFAGWACWLVRDRMRLVRWSILIALLVLHFSMSRPVWFIFSRISAIIGGDGWHRSIVIDRFLKHFSEWFIVGMEYKDTASWAATVTKWGGIDVTNYYVSLGINGGLITLLFFITMLVCCFKVLGRARYAARQSKPLQLVLWGAGSAVCAHAINLTAVTYFDQSYVVWYLHLAIASSMALHCYKSAPQLTRVDEFSSSQPVQTPVAAPAIAQAC